MILKTNLNAEYQLLSFDADSRQAALTVPTDRSVLRLVQDFEAASSFDVLNPLDNNDIRNFTGYNLIRNITNQGEYYLVILERGEN